MIDETISKSSSMISSEEMSVLFYIGGYLSKKFNLLCSETNDVLLDQSSEFTMLLNRGMLKTPPHWLLILLKHTYTLHKLLHASCASRVVRLFEILCDAIFIEIDQKLLKTITNCFFKGFIKRETENILIPTSSAINERKIAKLSSSCI